MAKTKTADRTPDLREFIKENDQRVYDFCGYLCSSDSVLEDLVLSIFKDFGEYYRSHPLGTGNPSNEQMQIRLFQIAWSQVESVLQSSFFPILGGRDTRLLKGLDDNILPTRSENREKTVAKQEVRIRERLARVDPDLRAPVVLRDILKFDDEAVAKVLGLRWGVYRHRLHRGRLDFKDSLKGTPMGQSLGKDSSADA